jgi:hypothetical protein
MAEPARLVRAQDVYCPVRDLAAVLHGALRRGAHPPAVLGALRRLEEGLEVDESMLASAIEARIRARLDGAEQFRRMLADDPGQAASA